MAAYRSNLTAVEARIKSLTKKIETHSAELVELEIQREELLASERGEPRKKRKNPRPKRSSQSLRLRLSRMVRSAYFIVVAIIGVCVGGGFVIGDHEVSQSEQLRLHGLERQITIVDRVSDEGNYYFLVNDSDYGRYQVKIDRTRWERIDVDSSQIVTIDPDDFSNRVFGPRAEIEESGLGIYLLIGYLVGLFAVASIGIPAYFMK